MRSPTDFSLCVYRLLLWATLLALSPSSRGASRVWDGSQNGNLSTAANWVGNIAPTNGDDIFFQNGVTQLLVTNDFSPNRRFNSIFFQGSNYFLRGNSIIVSNGITSDNSVGSNTIDADVDVRAAQTWEATGPLAVLDINGDINLNANTLTVKANTGDFFFSGIVSGTGNLVKTNVGTLRMDGIGHNTYSGFTRFDGGVMELDKFGLVSVMPLVFSNFTAIAGDLTIGDGNGLVGTDVLRLLADDQIADTSDVTVQNSGVFDLNDHSDRIGSLTMQGGTVDSGTGTLILGGNLTSLADVNGAVINGKLSLGGASRTFDISSGPPGADMRINAVISGDATSVFVSPGITKIGGGSLFLAGTNTYNGNTVINEGQVALLADRALGATSGIFAATGTFINESGNLFLSGVQVTNETLTINSGNPGGAFNASGSSIWTGDIILNTNTFISSSGSLVLNGEISGAGGFTKLGGGSLTLAGTNRNTYTGTTILRDGTLLLDKDTTAVIDGAMSGDIIIGEDELPENTDLVRYLRCCQIPDSSDVTINASGLLDLNGFGDNVHNIIFNGGDLDAPSPGSILPVGDITVNPNANSMAIISGRMSVLGNPTINVTGHNFSPDIRIDAQLIGAGGFTKSGVGELSLNASNIYSGTTTVNDGFLQVDNSFALGTTANGTVVNPGAVLALRSDAHVGAEALTLAGTGQSSFGALSSSFGSNSWAGDITLSSNATISVETNDFLNISGAITGSFDVTKTGTGTLIFSGGSANSFDNMFVNAGTLALHKSIANAAGPADLTIGDGSGTDIVRWDADNQIADTTQIHISLGGRLDLNDMLDTTGAIDGRGLIDLGSGTLREGADNGSSVLSGQIIGTGTLFKLGTGTWTLTGNNSYSGQTTVSAGTLVVDGAQPQSPVTVNGTATLEGSGVIGDLHVFGSVRPGASPGILTCSNVLFASQGDYFVEVNGANPGTGYDQLNVRGTNNLGSSTLHLSVDPAFAPFEGEEFVILNNDGSEAIVGTFAGLPGGSLITSGGLQFRIRYSAIFENDVVLSVTNTAARIASTAVSGGNLDGNIDVNECNLINVVITNVLGGTVSGLTATLVPKTAGVSVTVGNSAYPNMVAGGRGTNSTPFQFSTGPGFLCGTNVEFCLIVHTATNGSFSIPFSVPSGSAATPVQFTNNIVTAIPDNSFMESSIVVSGLTTPIKRVVVSLYITHTSDSDLDISLIGPDGTTVDLSSDNGGNSDDYGADCANRTIFSDAGLTPITSGSAPFLGTFRPEQALSAFNEKFGANANGTWRLHIADDTPGGVGSLRCWSLSISPTACDDGGGACESCPGNRTITGVLGNGSSVQTSLLQRNGVKSTCGLAKACPGATGLGFNRFYDAYTFQNGESDACITVTLEAACNLLSAAYSNSYTPSNLCSNYMADMGLSLGVSGTPRDYSFNAAAGARFVVVVMSVGGADTCGYTLTVNGGSCQPALNITQISASQVDLDWTTAAIGFGVEHTNVLGNTPNLHWVPVPGTPTISGGRFHVIDSISLPPTNDFYQLRKP